MEDLKVAVEFRPKIRTCHFFVKFENKLETVEVNDNMVLIKEDDGKLLKICVGNIKLASEIASLQINRDSLYFQTRCLPEDNTIGSFHYEFLLTRIGGSKESAIDPYKPQLEVNTPAEIFCRSCTKSITDCNLLFQRILPLPSSDGSDFFCHKHSDFSVDLNPKEKDCFYGNFYIKISPTHCSMFSADGILTCQRCFYWLGIKEKSSVFLWNSSISFTNVDCANVNEVAVEDFMSLIKFLMHKNEGVTCKLIMYCRFSCDQCFYLLVWILDRNLSLLVNDTIVDDKINLKEIKVAKILYNLEKSLSEVVKGWQQDVRVIEEQISKPMMEEGLSYFKKMSLIIPDSYKECNGMHVSYLPI